MPDVNSTSNPVPPQDSTVLLFEHPIAFYPALARVLGSVENAIVLQQIRYWTQLPQIGKLYRGRRWVRNTVAQWVTDNFYFWSEDTVWRILTDLRELGVIDVENLNDHLFDQTRWYAINYQRLDELVRDSGVQEWLNDRFRRIAESIPQNREMDSAESRNGFREIAESIPQKDEIDFRKSAESYIQTNDSDSLKYKESSSAKKPRAKTKSETVFTPELKDRFAVLCYGTPDSWKSSRLASQLMAGLRELIKLTPLLTVSDLDHFDQAWRFKDFRGKQGNKPLPRQVVDTWITLLPTQTEEPTYTALDFDYEPAEPLDPDDGAF